MESGVPAWRARSFPEGRTGTKVPFTSAAPSVRANVIAGQRRARPGGGGFARSRRGAGSFRDHEEVVLLFEHDLYDRGQHPSAALGCYLHQPSVKISSGRKEPTTQLGASTTPWMRRSTATLHKAYASSRERPCLSTSCSIVARTAPLVASIRSGATPIETW